MRSKAESIWRAGVLAVDSERLVSANVAASDRGLVIAGETIPLRPGGRIVVVGAGKAGTGMAIGFVRSLEQTPLIDRLTGWVNVPADTIRPCPRIHLHAARPARVNEPTADGVFGAMRILDLVGTLTADDVCVVLISGGGSALLPAPADGVSLADKQLITRALTSAGASIEELNCVRRHLSRIKGGGLARAADAASVHTLVISDVIGDPLEVIASGPTMTDQSTPQDALQVLERRLPAEDIPDAVRTCLARKAGRPRQPAGPLYVRHVIIGNNAMAMEAAAVSARASGFSVRSLGSGNRGEAGEAGRDLAEMSVVLRREIEAVHGGPVCVLSGGEPVVHLVPEERRGLGGRNQELVLSAVERLWDDGMHGLTLLSGGTDGEDGPTDAAGAVADAELIHHAKALGLEPSDFLENNNAYRFFDRTGGLLRTGPTHTNVMDLRVVLIAPIQG